MWTNIYILKSLNNRERDEMISQYIQSLYIRNFRRRELKNDLNLEIKENNLIPEFLKSWLLRYKTAIR